MSDATETHIADLLARIPADARMTYEHGPTEHQMIPVGAIASRALAEIKRLSAPTVPEMKALGSFSQVAKIPTGALESGEVVTGPVQMVAVRFGDIQVNAPMPGFRHHHILTVASYFGHFHGEQGFATADGSFLTREEAAKLALESGQVTKLIAGPDLYSEDIW